MNESGHLAMHEGSSSAPPAPAAQAMHNGSSTAALKR